MSLENRGKLNRLLSDWPAKAVYACSWLHERGFGFDLINKYRRGAWLTGVGHGAVARAGDPIEWSGGLYAIQTQLKLPIHVGGKSALLLKGYGHFLPQGQGWELSLFSEPDTRLPAWFKNYSWTVKVAMVSKGLFREAPFLSISEHNVGAFSIQCSSPERAILEFLSLVPQRESFEEGKLLMEGLTTLRPKIVQELLEKCHSIKVKRLFLLLAEESNHPWNKKLNILRVKIGKGKRVIVKNGMLNEKYRITVPKETAKGKGKKTL